MEVMIVAATTLGLSIEEACWNITYRQALTVAATELKRSKLGANLVLHTVAELIQQLFSKSDDRKPKGGKSSRVTPSVNASNWRDIEKLFPEKLRGQLFPRNARVAHVDGPLSDISAFRDRVGEVQQPRRK